MKILSGYTPDGKHFDLTLIDNQLYIVTDEESTLYNEEYYEEDEIFGSSALASVKASLISDGYRL